MNSEITTTRAHSYQLMPGFAEHTDSARSTNVSQLKYHPAVEFNSIFSEKMLEILPTRFMGPQVVLFHGGIRLRQYDLRAKIMLAGTIAEVLHLKNVIPRSGPIYPELLGAVILDHARRIEWIGADFGVACALVANQERIPRDDRFDQLNFLFPGTIIFDDKVGICIPTVVKKNGEWVVSYRDIHSEVVVGIDLHMV